MICFVTKLQNLVTKIRIIHQKLVTLWLKNFKWI